MNPTTSSNDDKFAKDLSTEIKNAISSLDKSVSISLVHGSSDQPRFDADAAMEPLLELVRQYRLREKRKAETEIRKDEKEKPEQKGMSESPAG